MMSLSFLFRRKAKVDFEIFQLDLGLFAEDANVSNIMHINIYI